MNSDNDKIITIIGAGLAGSEAAWQLAIRGFKVSLYEMRPKNKTPAHKTSGFAELVCSNSFRSDDINNAVGLLHEEMRICGSLVMEAADSSRVPAGSALAVDRNHFSDYVTQKIENHPNIQVINEEFTDFDDEDCNYIIATGPLTSDALSQKIIELTGHEYLDFFDAIAPVIYSGSINMDIAWNQSRYDKGDGQDYINCPMDRDQYYNFIDELLNAEKMSFKDWEQDTPYFNGCLPIEVMAERGVETLRYGPMKPVGLTNPYNPEQKPYAVVQLRYDNKSGTLRNIVGFQTKMKHSEQTRVLRMIPGLENAEFAKLGGIHRNTFIKSPALLNEDFSLKSNPNIKFAGQITGVEGYLESAAIGMLVGIQAANASVKLPPKETALGALASHIISDANLDTFQPTNVNYGLFPALENQGTGRNRIRGAAKKEALSVRAIDACKEWQMSCVMR